MPNGYPYIMRSSDDFCQHCGETLCDHEKERETHDGGSWSYNYVCSDGSEYVSPVRGGR